MNRKPLYFAIVFFAATIPVALINPWAWWVKAGVVIICLNFIVVLIWATHWGDIERKAEQMNRGEANR